MSSVACSFSLKRVRARVGNSPGIVYRSDRPIVVDPVSRPISDLIAQPYRRLPNYNNKERSFSCSRLCCHFIRYSQLESEFLASETRKTWIYIQYAIKGFITQKSKNSPLLSFRSARAWHSLLAELHTKNERKTQALLKRSTPYFDLMHNIMVMAGHASCGSRDQ